MSEMKFSKRQYKILHSVTKDHNLDNIMKYYGYSGCNDYLELYDSEKFHSETFDFSDKRYDINTEIFLSQKTTAHCDRIKAQIFKDILFVVFSTILSVLLAKIIG